ncbi:SNF2-related protein [Desulfatirhabdium butyrativorans]|uniref:SNF2-related protein n=1 Tax=Desulfatirhabdium butyrativorans TaxID=340467 RepID=UPI0003FEACEC|nr:SNF2-related protein [Desulfatirhabdium butyrativorans]
MYRSPDGRIADEILYRHDEARLEIVEQGRPWSFDADGALFRLVAEARRIRLAHLFDPVLAVHTSLVEPLPHQIPAVYEAMLPRQPLRFLLADDPGAGKTIMAGLLMKELIARGDLKRCLIVCPGNLVEQWQDELYHRFHLPFEIMTNDKLEAARTGNWFQENDLAIVRRRLFEPLARPDAFKQRDVTARAFADLYRAQAAEFPAECKTGDYEKRIQAAYPIHPLPRSNADVPEDSKVGLVVLSAEHPYTKEPGNAAEVSAQAILESRGNTPRLYRNTLVFLAADKVRLQDLDEELRRFRAWESILAEKETLNLDPHQVRQAETQKQAADGTVTARLPETYQWLLVPEQTNPQAPMRWQAVRLSGSDALAVRASKKLKNDEMLITSFAASRLRMELDRVPLWRGDRWMPR